MSLRGPLAVLAGLSGAIAVAAGAYGAHGATGQAAEWLRTGAQYQLVHAVAAFAVASRPFGRQAGWSFVAGGAIFAGTLYLMALGAPHWLGAVTPIGGLLLIVGWLLTAAGRARFPECPSGDRLFGPRFAVLAFLHHRRRHRHRRHLDLRHVAAGRIEILEIALHAGALAIFGGP